MTFTALALLLIQGSIPHTFSYVASQDLNSVSVAGSFNGWNKDVNKLTKNPNNKTWTTRCTLTPGKHHYKFVLNGENWITDPKALRNEDDGNGNVNSVLLILPPGYEKSAKIGDRDFTEAALRHTPAVPDINWDRGTLTLMFRARPNDIKDIELEVGSKRIPMKFEGGDELYANYTCTLPWDLKKPITYRFILNDGGPNWYFASDGLGKTNGKAFQITSNSYKPFEVPNWVEKTVFYQIFPDRFDNGNKQNDPKDVVAWNTSPQWFNRFGGDAAGVAKHLTYLQTLGVNSVYFNPIFKSPSNHRYDATDYLQIDPEFGTNEEFIQLTKSLTKVGIRSVVDGVFNHTATNFWAFQDIIDNGEKSSYKNWYTIRSFPVVTKDPPNYEAWFGFAAMPKLNLANPETQKYLLDVPGFWMSRANISGWRLDVANEVPDWFWRLFRKRVKGINPQSWIVGEVWGDGSRWLTGDQWDSVMNYQFRDAVLGFVAERKTTPTQFANRLMQVYRQNVPQVSRNMMNLLGSHDTPRILTLCKNDQQSAMLAATIQFGWVGAPSIYYGDELGMEGDRDPDNRRAMRWELNNPQNAMLSHYQKLISARRSCLALQSGDPIVVSVNNQNETLILGRAMPGKNSPAALIINRSSQPQEVLLPSVIGGHKLTAARDLAGTAISVRQVSTGYKVKLAPKSAVLFGAANSQPITAFRLPQSTIGNSTIQTRNTQ